MFCLFAVIRLFLYFIFCRFTVKMVKVQCHVLELKQILAEGHVAVPPIVTTLGIVKVVVVAAKAPG